MWRRIIALNVLSIGLLACTHPKNQPPEEIGNNASLCEILKQKITVETDQNYDPATMKRKTATDQALLSKQYDSYGCPEIIDSAPPP